MNILITGAGGFIGSAVTDEALRRGMTVYAGVRSTTNRRWLTDPRITFVDINIDSQAALVDSLTGLDIDYVVHAAGVTKSTHSDDFMRVNADGTRNIAIALQQTQPTLRRFVFLSSLSVLGPVDEAMPHREITADDTPHPNTAYGRSKLAAEKILDGMDGFPCITLRPTGVYGPRERDYYLMAKSVARHVDFAAGFRRQDLTFIYVKDVVQAVFKALDHGTTGKKYLLSDGRTYTSRAFSSLIRHELGDPFVVRMTAPLWMLRAITTAGEWAGRVTGQLTALNADKYNLLAQRNFRCDITPARTELDFAPEYDLARGVAETIRWYKENKWL